MGRRKQPSQRDTRSSKGAGSLKNKAPLQEKRATDDRGSRPSPQNRPLPPAHPPRRNLPLLIFSTALFLLWLGVLLILANFR